MLCTHVVHLLMQIDRQLSGMYVLWFVDLGLENRKDSRKSIYMKSFDVLKQLDILLGRTFLPVLKWLNVLKHASVPSLL